jgi:D-threo-aldose 1-dehydrogenase
MTQSGQECGPFPEKGGLGTSGIRLSTLGFGAAAIGNLYSAVDDATAEAAIAAALERGIRYFDTAPYYGYGLSEERLGRALGRARHADVIVSTKVGRLVELDDTGMQARDGFAVSGRRAVFDYSRDGILRSFESSLKRLGRDRVEILLLHDVGPPPPTAISTKCGSGRLSRAHCQPWRLSRPRAPATPSGSE